MRVIDPYRKLADARGAFLGIINSGQWEEMNYVETKAGQSRGGHYHRETRELFFIIEGEIEIGIGDPSEGATGAPVTVTKGAIVIVEPGEVHTFTCRTDARWINALSRRMDDRSPDIHRAGA